MALDIHDEATATGPIPLAKARADVASPLHQHRRVPVAKAVEKAKAKVNGNTANTAAILLQATAATVTNATSVMTLTGRKLAQRLSRSLTKDENSAKLLRLLLRSPEC